MFFEIDENGKMVRAMPGYFEGFKKDLAGVDVEKLGDVQKDYLVIPKNKIKEFSEKETKKFTERLETLRKRKNAYRVESDPLYMEWQFDQTEEAKKIWVDKIKEIKNRYKLK